MGGNPFSFDDWDKHSRKKATSSTHDTFKRSTRTDFTPKNFTVRESRDSDLSPESTAIILGLDGTGSMGEVARQIANIHLGTVMKELYTKNIVPNPHIMAVLFRDIKAGDTDPVQVTQFETDMKVAEQISDFAHVGTGGGSNQSESYDAVWYIAGTKTSIDCYEKRGKKGYLFTIGDERAPYGLTVEDLARIGISSEADITAEAALATAQRMYNVFHIIIEEGGGYGGYEATKIDETWQAMLGQRVINLSDMTKLAEVITATIRVNEGADLKTAASGFDSATSSVITSALAKLPVGGLSKTSDDVIMY